jgi:cytidylate kinase
MVVAVDGPAGVGKSTVAKKVAESIGFLYLNSGSFYRAVTWAVLEAGIAPDKPIEVIRTARMTAFGVKDGAILIDGRSLEGRLHSDEVDRWVPIHSGIGEVRDVVNALLRDIARGKDVIADGRDIGTVVFPNADVKIYLDADVKIRALRRFNQGVSTLGIEEIENSIAKRDSLDKKKPSGSLKIAPDALYLDTTHLTIDRVCEKVVSTIRKKQTNLGDIYRI